MTPEQAAKQGYHYPKVGDAVLWRFDCAGNWRPFEPARAVVTATKRAEYSHMIKGDEFHVWVPLKEICG